MMSHHMQSKEDRPIGHTTAQVWTSDLILITIRSIMERKVHSHLGTLWINFAPKEKCIPSCRDMCDRINFNHKLIRPRSSSEGSTCYTGHGSRNTERWCARSRTFCHSDESSLRKAHATRRKTDHRLCFPLALFLLTDFLLTLSELNNNPAACRYFVFVQQSTNTVLPRIQDSSLADSEENRERFGEENSNWNSKKNGIILSLIERVLS